jgi:hypothetical protein
MESTLLTRRYRITIDVDVTVEDVRLDEDCAWVQAQPLASSENGLRSEVSFEEKLALERQRQLLMALLANAEPLDAWLRDEALRCVAYEFEEVVPDLDCEALLEPVVEQLPRQHRNEYRAGLAAGDWYDDSNEFFRAFKSRIRHYFVAEVAPA